MGPEPNLSFPTETTRQQTLSCGERTREMSKKERHLSERAAENRPYETSAVQVNFTDAVTSPFSNSSEFWYDVMLKAPSSTKYKGIKSVEFQCFLVILT
jgi:hypothetical protein